METQIKTSAHDNSVTIFDATLFPQVDLHHFSPAYWQSQNAITGSAQGRGTTYFFHWHGREWVLRHYLRGGVIGKCLHDQYWYRGEEKTRALREFRLLQQMVALGLPVPRPAAVRIERQGLIYRADIITQRIQRARSVVARLQEKPLPDSQWFSIGQTLRRFHQQGIDHHDLNAHNILLDAEGGVWLIDFDQGRQRSPQAVWQQRNLARLRRSLAKEQLRQPNLQWQTSHWQALEAGYAAGPSP